MTTPIIRKTVHMMDRTTSLLPTIQNLNTIAPTIPTIIPMIIATTPTTTPTTIPMTTPITVMIILITEIIEKASHLVNVCNFWAFLL